MSFEITLTDEQAEWLTVHLGALIHEADWGEGQLKGDSKEHAETIKSKLDKISQSRNWGT